MNDFPFFQKVSRARDAADRKGSLKMIRARIQFEHIIPFRCVESLFSEELVSYHPVALSAILDYNLTLLSNKIVFERSREEKPSLVLDSAKATLEQ